jgi:Cell division protein CrgA
VPKSKVRKKSVYTPPEGVLPSRAARARAAEPSPRWFAPVMVGLMVLGLLWIVVYYVAGQNIGFMNALGAKNFLIGFGAMVIGLIMSMRWR